MIRGNHDKVASGIEEPLQFNHVPADAARWTHATLSQSNRQRIAALPTGPIQVNDAV